VSNWSGVWHDIWTMGISAGDKAFRTVAVYGGILVLLRLAGKRELAQLNSFDLVVLLLLSNVVQNAIIGNDNSVTGGLLGAAVLVVVNVVLVRAAFMVPLLGRILQGTSTTLYRYGHFDDRKLLREAITHKQVVAALRRQGLELDEVMQIDLEPEGTLNATPRPKATLDDVLAAINHLEQRLVER
jgi:uncharacterized membrane protein YcaP (DUF421 family)